jgi:glycosyltransferase involved in cell wall biosynthesis
VRADESSAQPLSVLHVVGGGGVGGVERVAAVLASTMQDRGHRVRLVVVGRGGPMSDAARLAGVDVVVLGMELRATASPRAWGRSAVAMARLAKEVGSGQWDVVQTHLFRTAALVTPIALLRRRPVVGALHGIDTSAVQRRLMGRLLLLQDAAVCASHALRRRLVTEEGFPPGPLHAVPNGVATDGPLASVRPDPSPAGADRRIAAREALGLPQDALLVGCLGRLYPRKGQRRLVAAFREVADRLPESHLVLAGDGPDRDAIGADVARAGLGARVHLLGELRDPGALLRALDVLAVPSDYEGFGLVVVEAMMVGLPVVASAAGGPEDIVEDDVTGRLVAAGPDGVDVGGLSGALVDALSDPGRRSGWAAAARERLPAYLAPAMAEGYELIYRTVLERRASVRSGGHGRASWH